MSERKTWTGEQTQHKGIPARSFKSWREARITLRALPFDFSVQREDRTAGERESRWVAGIPLSCATYEKAVIAFDLMVEVAKTADGFVEAGK